MTLSVVFPEAPRQTTKGNTTAKHIVSYKPFIHKCSLPPILGIADKTTIEKLPIQKAPRTLTGLNTRDNNNPAGNENSNRKEPPIIFSSVKAKPTHISPSGPQRANMASPQPADNTNMERTFVGRSPGGSALRSLRFRREHRRRTPVFGRSPGSQESGRHYRLPAFNAPRRLSYGRRPPRPPGHAR